MCDNEVIGCFDGVSTVVQCPHGFLFDAASRLCAEKVYHLFYAIVKKYEIRIRVVVTNL